MKLNQTQSKEQNPLKSAAVRNVMSKYQLKSKPNLESNNFKKQVAKSLDIGYYTEIKRNKKKLEILNEL